MDGPGGGALDRSPATRRELDVLELVADGLTNAAISTRLGISVRTVESHVSSLLHKRGVGSRRELVDGRVVGDLPHQLDSALRRAPCVGRTGELEQLMTWWDAARSGTMVGVVAGPAGIGKSLLVATAAAQVHASGGRVLFGACTDGPHLPYEPFIAALEHEDVAWSEVPAARWQLLRRSTPGLFPPIADAGPEREVVDPAREQALVMAALHTCLATLAAAGPVLLVLEDLHWASVGTLDAVVHLARAGGAAPLMVLATTRDGPPSAAGASEALTTRLASLATAETLTLGGLDRHAAAVIISSAGSDMDPEQGVRDTGGNPLFLRELARVGPTSQSLRSLLADRFAQLDAADLDVVDAAAVIGARVDPALVAATLGRELADVLDAFERLEAVGVIGVGPGHGQLAFTHDVFHSVRYAALPAGRRMRLHAAVARALGHGER